MRRSGRYTVRSTCHAGIFYNSEYHVYEVAKPIEGVRAGPAEPWFRQPGGGAQYQLPRRVEARLKDGELVEVTGTRKPKR
ncbi:hypothetical protein C6Q05_14355 [Burkholderia multivorans]|nr:hypothetical protein C6Q05_14355 [Burkholderia multivorans]